MNTSAAPSTVSASAAASPPSRYSQPERASESAAAAGVGPAGEERLRAPLCTPTQAAATWGYLGRFLAPGTVPRVMVPAVLARCCLATNPECGLDVEAAAADADAVVRGFSSHANPASL